MTNDDELNHGGDVAAAIEAGRICAGVTILDVEGVPHAAVPPGVALESLEKLLPFPRCAEASQGFEEPDSFCAYIDIFKGDACRLYGFPDDLSIASVLDDHTKDAPRWRRHKALLQLKASPEWNAWVGQFEKPIDQGTLAEFLDQHIEQIAGPDAGELLDGIRSVQINNNWKCESVHQEGGDINFNMASETGAKTAKGRVPSRITLLIAPYRSWRPYSMTVFVTHRLKEQRLLFTLRGHQVDEIRHKAFHDVRRHVEEKLALPVLV